MVIWWSKRFPSQTWSTSNNACFVRLAGGPGNGQMRFVDHDEFHSMCFTVRNRTFIYRKRGRRVYEFAGSIKPSFTK